MARAPVEIVVRQRYGTYACRLLGATASCTAGADQAAIRLAHKLWGEGDHRIEQLARLDDGATRWLLTPA